MNTTTLRGIFPDPKPVHRRNFVRENIKHLKEIQGFIQETKVKSQSQEFKPNKFKNVAPRVYSNITTWQRSSKEKVVKQVPKIASSKKPLTTKKSELEHKIIDKGVQTERPEDMSKLYETGILKYPSPSVVTHKPMSNRGRGDVEYELTKNMQKLDLEEKQNYVKQNIKNLKSNKQKLEESPDPNLAPANYQKGAVPKYLKNKKEGKPPEFEGEHLSGLVLLPDEERKEYLRVARENYAVLIKELNSMPVSNDTLKKRKRKMEIEDELKRLDEVIKIFQKPKVFVKADA